MTEFLSVRQRGPMTETHHSRCHRRQLTRRSEVGSPIEGGEPKRLGKPRPEGHGISVKQDVAQNQHPILLSPERKVPWSMPGRLDYPQTPNLIPLDKVRSEHEDVEVQSRVICVGVG